MLGAPCSPCCSPAAGYCIRFVGSGFTSERWSVLNGTWYAFVPPCTEQPPERWTSPCWENAFDNSFFGPNGVGGAGLEFYVVPEDNYYDVALPPRDPRTTLGRQLGWFNFRAVDGEDSRRPYCSVRLGGGTGFLIMRTFTDPSDANPAIQEIVFQGEDFKANMAPEGANGATLRVQAFSNKPMAAASALDDASEVHIAISARGQTNQYTLAHTTDMPREVNTNRQIFDGARVFSYFNSTQDPPTEPLGPYYTSAWRPGTAYLWLAAWRVSCGNSGKLFAGLYGAVWLPGDAGEPWSFASGNIANWGQDVRDRLAGQFTLNDVSVNHRQYMPIIRALSAPGDSLADNPGPIEYPTFPLTFYNGPVGQWRDLGASVHDSLPNVRVTIEGVS